MARILLTWELGGGLGHLVRLKPFAIGLAERGHEVFAALKDVTQADDVFEGAAVSCLQAPIAMRRFPGYINRPHTFAQILHNVGFGEPKILRGLTNAWMHIYDYVQPDLIIFDHSPTALLASRTRETQRCYLGTGFVVPPDVSPLPNLRPQITVDDTALLRHEQAITRQVNELLCEWNAPLIQQLADLFTQVDQSLLATFRELDHYPQREGGEYFGAWPEGVGKAPAWPSGNGKRIFAYLKPFRCLPELLKMLAASEHRSIVHVPGANAASLARYESSNIRFERQPVELGAAGQQCDMAILNGTHGTTTAMMLAGKPTLQIPIHLEQAMMAQRVQQLGAGVYAAGDKPEQIERGLGALLSNDDYRQQAKAFAAR